MSSSFFTHMQAFILLTASFLPSALATPETVSEQPEPTSWVDPYIGTGGHGHVFLGANVPFGLVQLGPTNISQGWDWCSGYHFSDTSIIGFSHTHLSGTGCHDLGDVALMPAIGDVPLTRGTQDNLHSGLGSSFNRSKERVKPGYYAVHLDRFGIDVELTATPRTGFHKYTFPRTEDARIIVDLKHAIGDERQVETHLDPESDTIVSGFRHSSAWANRQKLFFVMEFSRPMKQWIESEGLHPSSVCPGKPFGQAIFDTRDGEPVFVKVGLSLVSVENAKANLRAELPGWDFDGTARKANQDWNRELSKIAISTTDSKVRRIFYTSLYHTMIFPAVCSDVNGEYRGADGNIHTDSSHLQYTGFSLWDTYRAAHPLMTLIQPEKVPDLINSMLTIYEQQGKLPVWHLMACETNCMVGNPAVCVVADAIMKDFQGISYEKAFTAMKESSLLDERGLKYLKEYGFIPYDKEGEGLSKCMEYAVADWSLAQVALKLGKNQDYDHFIKRSKSYKQYFDPETEFVRGLSSEKTFRQDFDPFISVHRSNDYTEGNAWQYTWLVPHDIDGLMELFGNVDQFLSKLDGLFTALGDLGKDASPDISGLIGQYAHGNEPSHHVAYMYTYASQPWKTADKVREILSTMYNDTPDGLCGNEDMGQMSAWYILSALGFYQIEPAGGKFVFGSPIIDQAELQVGNGKTFRIVVRNNSPEHKYIEKILLNGQPYLQKYINFKDIAAGGTLEIHMTGDTALCWLPSAKDSTIVSNP